jgi:hypothetical protein
VTFLLLRLCLTDYTRVERYLVVSLRTRLDETLRFSTNQTWKEGCYESGFHWGGVVSGVSLLTYTPIFD